MKRKFQGQYVIIPDGGRDAQAFVPSPLPPDPPVDWTPRLRGKFNQALLSLGRLDGIISLLPDFSHFYNNYIGKEAVISSMIDGLDSSLADLFLFEINRETESPPDVIREVRNYGEALYYGRKQQAEGSTISLGLIREVQGILLSGDEGADPTPGEFRRTRTWIGDAGPAGAVYVPPPAEHVAECMGKLELFINDQPVPTTGLLKAAFTHAQFEMIHPFNHGNGRIGRLLIYLILLRHGLISKPAFCPSLYFKTHRSEYFNLLHQIHSSGDWEGWLGFFAESLRGAAEQAAKTATGMVKLIGEDRETISEMGRAASSTLKVHRSLMKQPITTSGRLVKETGLSPATVNKSLSNLEKRGIVQQLTDGRRNRIFSYTGYIEIMSREPGMQEMPDLTGNRQSGQQY